MHRLLSDRANQPTWRDGSPLRKQPPEDEGVALDLQPAVEQLREAARLAGLATLLSPEAVAKGAARQPAGAGTPRVPGTSPMVDPEREPARFGAPDLDPERLRSGAFTGLGVGTSFLPGFLPGSALLEDPERFGRGGWNPNRIASGLRGSSESALFGTDFLSLRSEEELANLRGMIFGVPTGGWRYESYSGVEADWGWGAFEVGQMRVLASGEYAEVERQGIGRVRLRLGAFGITYQNDHDFLSIIGLDLPRPILGSDKDQGLSAALDLDLDLARVGRAWNVFGDVWLESAGLGLEINTGIPRQHGTPRSELQVYDLEEIDFSDIDRGEITICGGFVHRPSGIELALCGGWDASRIRTSIQNDLIHAWERVDSPDIPIDPAVGPYSRPVLDLELTIPF